MPSDRCVLIYDHHDHTYQNLERQTKKTDQKDRPKRQTERGKELSIKQFPDGSYRIGHPFLPFDGTLPLIYPASFEFMAFLVECHNGFDGNEEWRKRSLAIARRKSCYGLLVDDLRMVTDKGQEVFQDISKTYKFLLSGYRDNFKEIPKPEHLSNLSREITIEDILPYGTGIDSRFIGMLRDAYLFQKLTDANNLLYSEDSEFMRTLINKPDEAKEMAYDKAKELIPAKFKYARMLNMAVLDGIEVTPSVSPGLGRFVHPVGLRNRNRDKVALNHLIMYGLAEPINLERMAHQKGRGRPPVGAQITLLGTRFLELWIDQFDPTLRSLRV